ncbi:MAG: phosphate regulon transcriptional regulator PhoB [Gammaproteobacteria bacterium]|nr:phosphate regulon transcriptional regulator PhoB [Gammaproteobacteria bacterium]MCW8841411.1 phosphate regulon transcriptional regulator PhoB [Gammaproteobacteria bacterium]MCW8957943.1 phosphate regulon transcriptional regulator PhoB [Gammaproteobacteria bacterium]MCW8971680.1 phosphate regulon transcriptional regulator PhoB [Gammaproteobacteria bacterium]MCW8993415.1 phosphate regulon transcriptional regulator PhoB [Gammaproteobacteria bacterium]
MTGKRILLVEDEAAIREMTAMALERAGYLVSEAEDAIQAERLLADGVPDLILLDWMLPGSSGIELARRLRREEYTREVPIIMLTARSEEDDRIRGLDSGADDYVSKPFSPRELIARIKAVIRRASPEQGEGLLEVEGLSLDSHSHRVSANGQRLEMGPTEFRLLQFFMAHPERVYSRSQLLDMVWSRGSFVEERTVDVHIRRLRKVLADEGYDRYIQTVRGAGYRFSSQV